MIDFRINTFLTVCETLNFTRAAERLGLTQPAVSQHIHYLENYYNTKLFTYHGKKLSLTSSGETLEKTARTMQHDASYLREKIQNAKEFNHTLTFGSTLTIAEFVLPDKLAEYLNSSSNNSLRMVVANTQELLTELDRGNIDFALIEGYFPRDTYEHHFYTRERYIAVCAPNYHLTDKAYRLEELFQERLILRELGSGTRDVLSHYLEAQNLSIEDFIGKAEIGNINAIKTLVAQGCGITFLYETAAKKELTAGTLREIPLKDMNISHDFNFIWRKGSVFKDEYVQAFYSLHKYL